MSHHVAMTVWYGVHAKKVNIVQNKNCGISYQRLGFCGLLMVLQADTGA